MSTVSANYEDLSSELRQRPKEAVSLHIAQDLLQEPIIELMKARMKRRVTVQVPTGHAPSQAYPKTPMPRLQAGQCLFPEPTVKFTMPKIQKTVTKQISTKHASSKIYPKSPFLRPQAALLRISIPDPKPFVEWEHEDACPSSTSSTPLIDLRSPLYERETLDELEGLATVSEDEKRRRLRVALMRSLGTTGALSLATFGLVCWPFVSQVGVF